MWWKCLALAVALATAMTWPPPALAADQIGVVLMHGKQSAPEEHLSLATALTNAGFVTDVPEMCWDRAGASTTVPTAIACARSMTLSPG